MRVVGWLSLFAASLPAQAPRPDASGATIAAAVASPRIEIEKEIAALRLRLRAAAEREDLGPAEWWNLPTRRRREQKLRELRRLRLRLEELEKKLENLSEQEKNRGPAPP